MHIKNCGIGAIWLSPMYASPMVDFGYDISDFRNIEVILDLVPNHTSDDHFWFKESLKEGSPYRDYYIWRKGLGQTDDLITDIGSAPNNWLSVFGGSGWTYNGTSKLWYFHQFHRRQPDLNYRSALVRKEMEDIITFWLSKGVEGFRIDAVPHLFEIEDLADEPRSFLPQFKSNEYDYLYHPHTKDQNETYDLVQSWRRVLDNYANKTNTDEKIMMTEAYTSLLNTTKYYDFGSHVPFNFNFLTEVNNSSSPADFKRVIDTWITEANKKGGTSNWVMGNHDNPRTPTRYPERGDQMNMLSMILPGVAVTYYGEEIGMLDKSDISFEDTQDPQACQAGKDKYKSKSRDPNRTPMQWDATVNSGFNNGTQTWIPVHENYKSLNLAAEIAANDSHLKIYQKLVSLKTNSLSLINGSVEAVVSDDKRALSVIRNSQNESVVLIINFSNTATATVNVANKISINLSTTATVSISSLGSSLIEGTRVDLKNVQVPSKHSVVLIARTNAS
ncbi:hypothetical protein HCN44_006095 [Aphidius gifuensis]|uniref:alpha-glucosidase n=1 Tax=Aphidius gifuensis TaxID=684658 RepID=A0A834Y5E4_APHGI|nr:hypothetical protein HCN44_006095 [Aphidius gifuensis]